MWEEPCISGEKGSGAIFFCGCNLRCVFCQNYQISRGKSGHLISESELVEKMLRLQDEGANNINLVTSGHYMKTVCPAIGKARSQGLNIPIVYNTSAYESVDQIKALEGIVDVYLPDLKYVSSTLSERYSKKADYFNVASQAIAEMARQTKGFRFTDEETKSKSYDIDEYQNLCEEESLIMTKGTIVRHMILPGQASDSMAVIKYLLDTFGDKVFISIMNQYTPMPWVKKDFPEIYRKVCDDEYNAVLDYALDMGIENGFFQDGDVAMESFIPEFN